MALGLVALASTLARGEDKKNEKKDAPKVADGIYRIEINQGTRRSVEVVGKGDVSPSQIAAEQDAARAENEAAYVGEVQDLKRQYVDNERLLAARRHELQMRLYGSSTTSTDSWSLGYPGWGGYGYGGYWGGWGGYGYGGISGFLGGSTTVTNDLSIGAGPEGSLQTDMSRVIAAQSTPEYAAMVRRNHSAAVAVADGVRKGKVVPVADEPTEKATLTLKSGKDVAGLLLDSKDKDWIMLKDGDNILRIRASEVTMMKIEPVKKVKPA
jgi:hypothetical protein